MRMLKRGDPCPCCGQPIKWKNLRILQLLTYAVDGELTRSGQEELLGLIEKEINDGEKV